jgi:translation initiation factor IF-2
VRDGVVVYEGRVASLRRFKDDVTEVRDGFECGIGLENYQDLKQGDVIETFEEREVPRT